MLKSIVCLCCARKENKEKISFIMLLFKQKTNEKLQKKGSSHLYNHGAVYGLEERGGS